MWHADGPIGLIEGPIRRKTMCQAKVLLQEGDESRLLMEEVIHIKVDDDKVWLSTFFEDPKPFSAQIKEADFLKHTVTLTPLSEEESD